MVAVAAVCINKKAGDSGKLKEGQTEATVKKSDTKVITFAVPDIKTPFFLFFIIEIGRAHV